jgi:hypothetical protein
LESAKLQKVQISKQADDVQWSGSRRQDSSRVYKGAIKQKQSAMRRQRSASESPKPKLQIKPKQVRFPQTKRN